MSNPDRLEEGRRAFDRQAWSDALASLLEADGHHPLDVPDLERLATAQHMVGHDDGETRAWERAYQATVRSGTPDRAVRHAFHLVLGFLARGEEAQAGAWLGRAGAIVNAIGPDHVECGFLLIPEALRALNGGDPAAALTTFDQAARLADRFGDPDLLTLSRLGRGQSLVALGEIERGLAQLDEAMIAVTAGEVSPIHAGIVYCASIESFQSIFDLRRAQEWTRALSRWCDSQPDIVPFRGRCLVYRAELLQFHGLWQEAIDETRRARDWMSRPPVEPALGEALYQQAELHRLRGEAAAAEDAYREANQWGRRPEPGLALLRLGEGDAVAAAASISRALDEADDLTRTRLLGPYVEIMLGRGDVQAARIAADDLLRRAERFRAVLPRAIAARADGAVRLAEGEPQAALVALRSAWDLWLGLDAPYEAARVRVQIGLACRALGDRDAAELEFEAARVVFVALGAAPDLAGLDQRSGAARPGGLSDRELEILRLVAEGRTNRAIADELGISQRTVDRHVSNVFTKLGVSSRAAATAFAYEHHLV